MPLEQVGNALAFYGFYTSGKIGKTGIAPTVDVYRIGTDGASVQVVTAGASTEIGTSGLYRYGLQSALNTVEGEYLAMFRTSDPTVDARDIAAVWAVGKAGLEDLDAAVSTRATPADVEASVTSAVGVAVGDAVLTAVETALGAGITASIGGIVTAAVTAEFIAIGLTQARVIKLDNLDALVSSRVTAGLGALTYTATVKRQGSNVPIDGVAAWVTLDFEGKDIVAGTVYTDAQGQVRFQLEAGPYYLWLQGAGTNFVNPSMITVGSGAPDESFNGGVTFAYTAHILATTTNLPLPGVAAWITLDQSGAQIIAGRKLTDASGNVTFELPAGTYYLWLSHTGQSFTNPTTITVGGV